MISKRIQQIKRYVLSLGASRYLPQCSMSKHPNQIFEEIKGMGVTKEEWLNLTHEEALSLGFRPWSEDSQLLLVPSWLIPAIPEGIEFTNIDGTTFVYTATNADHDTRLGVLAYGLVLEKGEEVESKESP